MARRVRYGVCQDVAVLLGIVFAAIVFARAIAAFALGG